MVDALTKSMLSLTTGLQATSLALSNLPKKKMITKKRMIKQGVGNILGIGLIGTQAQMISKL